jgi:monoterpene epsilon-lactone hydrolase
MVVVRETHDRTDPRVGILGGMVDAQNVVAMRAPDAVDIRQLRAFIVVAEELNFGRAAQRLYLSQPALSRQIKALEQAVGCQLLLRDTHRAELTLAGQALLTHSRSVLAALEKAVATTQAVGGELNARMMAVWAPLLAVAPTVTSVDRLREMFEGVLASMPVPSELPIRPVRAGGVPSLVLGDEPALLYLHGGGFVLGSAYGYRSVVAGVVDAAGVGALVPDYRLAPEHPFPAALDDARAAYRWLVANRDASDTVLVADSSGCGLALALLRSLLAGGDPMPAGAVLMCPSLDASGGLRELGHVIGAAHDAATAYSSDAEGDLTGLAPLLIQAATDDAAFPEAVGLLTRARSCGVPASLERYGTAPHVFQLFWSFLPEAVDAMASAGEFVRAVRSSTATAAG